MNIKKINSVLENCKIQLVETAESTFKCPCCKKKLITTKVKKNEVTFDLEQKNIAFDGESIPFTYSENTNAFEMVDNVLLFGKCDSCKKQYLLMDLIFSKKGLFSNENQFILSNNEDSIYDKSVDKSFYQLIAEKDNMKYLLGTLTAFHNVKSETSKYPVYVFNSSYYEESTNMNSSCGISLHCETQEQSDVWDNVLSYCSLIHNELIQSLELINKRKVV